MRKRVEPTIVEKAIESVAGFDQVIKKLEQQVVLKGQSKSTLHNYIRRIASISLHFGKLPEQIDDDEINEYLTSLALNPKSPSRSNFKHAAQVCEDPPVWHIQQPCQGIENKGKSENDYQSKERRNSSTTHTTTYRVRPLPMPVLQTGLYAYARRDAPREVSFRILRIGHVNRAIRQILSILNVHFMRTGIVLPKVNRKCCF